MMNKIIENTPVTKQQVEFWRKTNTSNQLPLMIAKRNAKAAALIGELNDIRYATVTDVSDVNNKIDSLIEILMRGIEFK
jgi:hypothetical protein